MRKSELMTLWNVESWTVEPHGVYFVARQLAADGVANHEDHTIETQVENVEQAFKTSILVAPIILRLRCFHYQCGNNYMFN